MFLVFILFLLAFYFLWQGHRRLTLAFWLLSTAASLVLFSMHATDNLPLHF